MKLPFSKSHVCEKNKLISDGLVKTLNLHHTVIPAYAGMTNKMTFYEVIISTSLIITFTIN